MGVRNEYFENEFEEYRSIRNNGLKNKTIKQESNARSSSLNKPKENNQVKAEQILTYSKDKLERNRDKNTVSSLLEDQLKSRESIMVPRLELYKMKGIEDIGNSKECNIQKKNSSSWSNKVNKNERKSLNRFTIQTFNSHMNTQGFYNNSKLTEMK